MWCCFKSRESGMGNGKLEEAAAGWPNRPRHCGFSDFQFPVFDFAGRGTVA